MIKISMSFFLLMFALSSCAHVEPPSHHGVIFLKDGRQASGEIEYDNNKNVFELTTNSQTIEIPSNMVKRIELHSFLSDIEKAQELMQNEDYSAAAPLLRKAIDDDRPFGTSVKATRWLAECYLKMNKPREVLDLFQKKPCLLAKNSSWGESEECRRIHEAAVNKLKKQKDS